MARTVLVTGASRGIGKSIADRYTAADWVVVAPTRRELDLADPKSMRAFLADGAAGHVDALVNNAGENKVNLIDATSTDDWERMLRVNLTAAFQLVQACAPGMAERKWGRIVNISSIYSHLARPGRVAYSSSKSGLNGLTRAAAVEFGPHGVLANAVCPGFVDTELTRRNNTPEQIQQLSQLTALKRLAHPTEIAELVHFLGSESNTFITGETVVADGGFSCQ